MTHHTGASHMTNTAAQFNTSQHRLKFGSCGLSIDSFISLFTLIFCRCSFFSWIVQRLGGLATLCSSAAIRFSSPLCQLHLVHCTALTEIRGVSKWMVITVYLSIAYIAYLTLIELMYCSDGETRWWWSLKGASQSSYHDCWWYRYVSLGHKWW